MNKFKVYNLIFITVVLCLTLCACDNSNEASMTDNSSVTDRETPILVAGDFKPKEGAYITYEKALEQYGDTFIASLASSSAKNALMVPKLSNDITQIRISVPERTLVLESENGKAYHIYYGYCTNGEWSDIPADNYNLKTLGDLNSGFEDGWNAITGDHVVKMGPYVLLCFYSPADIIDSVKDSLSSEVLLINADSLIESSQYKAYQVCENALAAGTDNYDYLVIEFGEYRYIALEFSKLTTDYSVTVTLDVAMKPNYYTYTYNDIMEALNRK